MNTVPDDLVTLLWAPIEPLVYISRDQFAAGLAEWDVETVEIDGRPAFIVLTKGPEFHFTSLNSGARVSMKLIRDMLRPIIERHGCVTTTTPIDGADRQHRFNKLLGFSPVETTEFFVRYRLDQCL